MNFGTILNSTTKNCVSLMLESRDDESKSLARNFVRYIQLKEVLNKQFRVYTQLNSSFIKDKESAKMFVNETLSVLDNFSFEDILSYNHLVETRFNVQKIPSTDIDMSISKLIKYRTSEEKIGQAGYVEAFNDVVEHISTFRSADNKLPRLNESIKNSELKFLQPKHVVRIALKKFNEKYSSRFDEEDRRVFNVLKEGSEKDIYSLYENKVSDLIHFYDSVKGTLSEDLVVKTNKAIEKISSAYTQSNLLDAHELSSELEKLANEKV